jgi:tetratricopeptide (TPR) repeat protein
LLIAAVAAGPHNPTVGYDTLPQVNAWESLLTQAPVIVHYIRLTFWPRPLSGAYDWDVVRHLDDVLPAATAVVGLLVFSTVLWFRRPHWGWLGAWFFLLLAPTSSIMPIISETVAERRMYLPMLSFVVPAMLAAFWVFERLWLAVLGRRGARPVLAAFPFAVLAYFAATETAARARVFADEKTFWTDVFQKNDFEHSGFMTCSLLNAYAKVLLDERRHEEAIPLLRRAVACVPTLNDAYTNLAAALVDLGPANFAEAEKLYRDALHDSPDNANGWNNFAKLRLDQYQQDPPEKRLGPNDPRMQEAYGMVQRAIELNRRSPTYYSNLGSIAFHLGRVSEAVAAWGQALQLDPNNFNARSNRAIVLTDLGRAAEAVREFDLLLARDPNNVGLLINQARAYGALNDVAAARQRLQQALQLDPENPNALDLMRQLTQTDE